jgi:hydroxymethylpyrimidine pyrophosphatase-like HAD family hydrolase
VSTRLIALDLDGTLVKTSVLKIGQADRAAIASASSAGIRVILATARTPAQGRQFQAELSLSGPVIGNNGAFVELEAGKQLLHERIAAECATRIVSRLVESGFYPNVIQGNEIFRRRRPDRPLGPETTRIAFCEYTARNVDDLLPHVQSGATQIGVFAEALEPVLDAVLSEPVCALRYYEADLLTGAIFIDAAASKGNALRKVLEHLGIAPEDTVAIGDSAADITMFDVAGEAIAVANATPDVRAAADWVAPAQWDGGVAAAIARVMG